ncbi:MAG: hypothetical protein N3A38_02425 [Planctomycetota bacterium]|nr:hypothetical protein [Planctomycetota bacterium]
MIPAVLFVLGAMVAAEALLLAAAPDLVRRIVNAVTDGEMRAAAVLEAILAGAALYAGFLAL